MHIRGAVYISSCMHVAVVTSAVFHLTLFNGVINGKYGKDDMLKQELQKMPSVPVMSVESDFFFFFA